MIVEEVSPNSYNILTEHALQPHEAADVTVKVDVEVFVRITHRYDVIQLVVEVKPLVGNGHRPGSRSVESKLMSPLTVCTDKHLVGVLRCAAAHLHR